MLEFQIQGAFVYFVSFSIPMTTIMSSYLHGITIIQAISCSSAHWNCYLQSFIFFYLWSNSSQTFHAKSQILDEFLQKIHVKDHVVFYFCLLSLSQQYLNQQHFVFLQKPFDLLHPFLLPYFDIPRRYKDKSISLQH